VINLLWRKPVIKEYQQVEVGKHIVLLASNFMPSGTVLTVVETGWGGFVAAETPNSVSRFSYEYESEGRIWERQRRRA
jgi:hypothetical protein